jgi:hypothetical protein
MKKVKLLIIAMAVVMCCRSGIISNTVYAADNEIVVSNITSATATVDWSRVKNGLEDIGYVTKSYTVTWWSATKGTNAVVTNSTATSAKITGLPSGTDILLEVQPYAVNADGETTTGYSSCQFTTLSATDLNVNINNTNTANNSIGISATPRISLAKMVKTDLYVAAGNVDTNVTSYLEYQVIDYSSKKVVKTETSYSLSDIIYGLGRKIYGVKVRAVGYDADYNTIYSGWSPVVYTIAQPKVSANKKFIKKNSITVSFKKIKGAKSYTIYMRQKGAKSWKKIKTIKGNKYKITKFKGKKMNLTKKDYEYLVIANAKVGGKTIHSQKAEYIYTYSY